MRIATYTRISTDEKHQPYSLEAQADRLAAYARSQEDWEIVRRFSDPKSGATLERPDLERALLEAEAGRFDLPLVYRVDRLARSVRGLAHILERLDHARVLFRSATEPFDTSSSAGRMMVQMLGATANGRGGRYPYYVCFSRQRYGRTTCDADRLPAGKLEDAILAHLTAALADQPLVRETIDRAHARPRRRTPRAPGRTRARRRADQASQGHLGPLLPRLRGPQHARASMRHADRRAVTPDHRPESPPRRTRRGRRRSRTAFRR